MNRIISEHANSEGELISIEKCEKPGRFYGKHLLIIHDDPECSNTKAPILLDEGLRRWLIGEIANMIRWPRCSSCRSIAYDGLCTNSQCDDYYLNDQDFPDAHDASCTKTPRFVGAKQDPAEPSAPPDGDHPQQGQGT